MNMLADPSEKDRRDFAERLLPPQLRLNYEPRPWTWRDTAFWALVLATITLLLAALGWIVVSLWVYSSWLFLALWIGIVGFAYASYLFVSRSSGPTRSRIPTAREAALAVGVPSAVLLLATGIFWLTRMMWAMLWR